MRDDLFWKLKAFKKNNSNNLLVVVGEERGGKGGRRVDPQYGTLISLENNIPENKRCGATSVQYDLLHCVILPL